LVAPPLHHLPKPVVGRGLHATIKKGPIVAPLEDCTRVVSPPVEPAVISEVHRRQPLLPC
jgi:hypothetical protein